MPLSLFFPEDKISLLKFEKVQFLGFQGNPARRALFGISAAPVELQNWCNAQESLGLDLKGRIKRENNQVSNLNHAG
jgi:hypothetical protein